ncbi:unnamed protein product [Phytophthora fragariaefolia]|uniref:Unnamed protein product n=1 Tax=Phytophthora fragariaefolia TaxID=1490495 RepID=A0A9W6UCP8_9STRA|nr:unnamed protein product [Phytophthora fragariaefolia]
MVISEVPASPGDITRCLFPAKNNMKRKKAKGTKRPPLQLRFVLSPLPKHSSARNQGTSSEGHRGETSLTTALEETVIESEEEETAEPELQTCPVPPGRFEAGPVPSKLYDISGAHNPYWYKFIKLVPRPEFEHLQKPGNKHARVAYCTKCNAEVHFEKGRSRVKMHLQVHHPAYFRDCEKKKKSAKDGKVTIASGAPHSTSSKKKRVVAVTPEQQRRANHGEAIAEGLTKLFKHWGLNPSFCIKLVRDGASNAVLASNLMGVSHMSCIAHSLHLVVAGALIKRTRKVSDLANSSGLVLESAPEYPQGTGETVGPVLPAPPAIPGLVAVPRDDVAKSADNEAEPWEQDRSIRELANFLRQWHVMEQLYALDEVRALVQRFRSLATYFHSSQKATSCLNAIQNRLMAEDRTGEDELHTGARRPLKVMTDCPTRWNSARSDSKDWFTIKCLIALLDPIAATSELLGGQGYPTLALAFPCLRQIERTLNRDDLFDEEALLVEDAPYKQNVLDLMTTVRLAFVGLFERRFADLPTDLLWISYLDPRLTNMEGLTDDQCKEAITGLIDAAIAMAKQENLNQSQSPQSDKDSKVSQGSSIPKKQRTTALEGVFGKRVRRDAQVDADARVKRLEMCCNAEVYRYLDEVADTEFDVDPLEWWRLHGRPYPYLAPLARQWLACVATSVPSERAFSSAGNIINCKRAKLDPSLVRDLLFIHDNFEFPEWETDAEATTDPSHEKVNQSKRRTLASPYSVTSAPSGRQAQDADAVLVAVQGEALALCVNEPNVLVHAVSSPSATLATMWCSWSKMVAHSIATKHPTAKLEPRIPTRAMESMTPPARKWLGGPKRSAPGANYAAHGAR